jgi:hypothetical protein
VIQRRRINEVMSGSFLADELADERPVQTERNRSPQRVKATPSGHRLQRVPSLQRLRRP